MRPQPDSLPDSNLGVKLHFGSGTLAFDSSNLRAFEPAPLLHFNGRPGIGELLPDGFRLVLAHAFLDRFGRAVHEILGVLQAQAGDFANRLDDVDFIGADRGKNHGEFRLLLSTRRPRSRRPTAARYGRILFHARTVTL